MFIVHKSESTIVTHWVDVDTFNCITDLVKIWIYLQAGYEYFNTSWKIAIELAFFLVFLAGCTKGAWIKPNYHQTYTNGITSTFILHFKMKRKMVHKRFYDGCSINKHLRSWNEMRSGYIVVHISFIPLKYHYF